MKKYATVNFRLIYEALVKSKSQHSTLIKFMKYLKCQSCTCKHLYIQSNKLFLTFVSILVVIEAECRVSFVCNRNFAARTS